MDPVIAEIFSQGDEVVAGHVADTNAAWLSQQLARLGFDLARHSVVGDHLERMVEVLREIAGRADSCICTGGLGPTVDDLTAEAVGLAFHRPLRLDSEALRQIREYFAGRGYAMPDINRKQALLPVGAQRLDNRWGTAPGFALRQDRCYFVFLPGVPAEMKAMFRQWVEPDLVSRFRLEPPLLIVLHTLGLGEATLQERLQALKLPEGVRLGFRAGFSEVQVKLLFPPGSSAGQVDTVVQHAIGTIGDAVFSVDGWDRPGGSLAGVVGRLLDARQATLATAETVSAGQLAWQCRSQPWLLQAIVAPDAARVCRTLGLEASAEFGELDTAGLRIAARLREIVGSAYALTTLGAMPTDPTSGCPSHTPPHAVHVALAGPSGTLSKTFSVAGTPERRQTQAAALSLDLLRRHLTPAMAKRSAR
jgi:competence/damage-inducible protein CinA-like protein